MQRAREVKLWMLLWVLILVPRVFFLFSQPLSRGPHLEVERTAACMAQKGFLGEPYPGYSKPSAHVAPLYPTVLAGIYSLIGIGRAGHLVQSILSILVTGIGISLLPFVSRSLYGSSTFGWIAAFLMSVLPYGIGYIQVHGHWEQHCSFLLLSLYLLLLLRIHREAWRSTRLSLFLGLMTGLCMLTNPQFLFVFALFLAYEAIVHRNMLVVRGGAVALASLALIVSPWVIRNYQELGGFCLIRSNAGLEMAIGNHDDANGKTYTTYWDDPNCPIGRLHPYSNTDEVEVLNRVGELKYMEQRQQEALHWIRDHPHRWIQLTITRVYLFWFQPPDMWSPSQGSELVRRLRSLSYSVFAVSMLGGLILLFKSDRSAFFVVLAVLIGMSGSYYLTHVDPRYMYPLHGIVLVLAGRTLAHMGKVLKQLVLSQ
jgi:hypothetical protein